MSEMMIQASFNTGNKTLINAKGSDEESFRMSLAIVHDHLQEILNVEQMLHAVKNVQAAGLTAAPPPPAANDSWIGSSFADATVPSCAHGPRTPISKIGQDGKPYKGWFCSAPQGTAKADKCKNTYVTMGTPEWNNFPV